MATVPSARPAVADSADGIVKTSDQAPAGHHRPFRALPADNRALRVVMLVPVLRGRTAVTLGHDTS
jgi:hypothetical protein